MTKYIFLFLTMLSLNSHADYTIFFVNPLMGDTIELEVDAAGRIDEDTVYLNHKKVKDVKVEVYKTDFPYKCFKLTDSSGKVILDFPKPQRYSKTHLSFEDGSVGGSIGYEGNFIFNGRATNRIIDINVSDD